MLARWAAIVSFVLMGLPGPASAGLQFGVVTPNLKVRQSDRPTLSPSASLRAARNEFEAFQLVFLSSGGSTQGVSARLGQPLTGPGTIPAKNVVLYAVRYYNVGSPSNAEGASGPWPDPLVPDVDTYFGEKRNAFPFDVPSGQSRVVWVDVLVPQNAQPGNYAGTIEVTVGGSKQGEVPIALEVGTFALPSTATLASNYGMDWDDACEAHYGNSNCGPTWNPDPAEALHELYVRSALEHRFTIGDSYYQPPTGTGQVTFDKYVLPLLNGTAPTRLPGARLTSINIDAEAGWVTYAKKNSFFERTVYYPVDEPGSDAATWTEFRTEADKMHALDPDARVIITGSIQDANKFAATSKVDIFCPVLNELEDKADGSPYKGDQCAAYTSWLGAKSNHQLWAYQSCESHDCGGCGATTTNAYYNGWPSRVIDSSAVQGRAFGWIAYRHNLAGELYFQTTHQLMTAWSSNGQCAFGGQGDGTIFYPGKPAIVGGSKDIPIESIRMKLIREGMEDFEYLVQARARDPQRTKTIVDSVFPATFSCAQPAHRLDVARIKLFDLLMGRPSLPDDAGPGPNVDSDGANPTDGGPEVPVEPQGNPGDFIGGSCGCDVSDRTALGWGVVLVALLALIGAGRRPRHR